MWYGHSIFRFAVINDKEMPCRKFYITLYWCHITPTGNPLKFCILQQYLRNRRLSDFPRAVLSYNTA